MGRCASKLSKKSSATQELEKETHQARAWLANELANTPTEAALRENTCESELRVVDADNEESGLSTAINGINDKPCAPEVLSLQEKNRTREKPWSGSGQGKFKKAANAIMTVNKMKVVGDDGVGKRADEERIQLEDMLGTGGNDEDRVVLSDISIRRTRPLSAVSLCSVDSTLTLQSDSSVALRIDEWDRATDRNLCHVYRLCEDYQRFGYGQIRPDRHLRGVDFLVHKAHTQPNASQQRKTPAEAKLVQHDAWKDDDDDEDTKEKQALRKCEYWNTLGSTMPGFLTKLASVASFVDEAQGQIVFRQGDPSGNVYLLVRGEVSVHRLSAEELTKVNSPRAKDCRGLTTLSEASGISLGKSAGAGKRRRRSSASISSPTAPLSPISPTARASITSKTSRAVKDNQRYYTSEGFSTFTKESKIGDQVALRGMYTAIGEKLSLAKGVKRPATIRCESACEFLVIGGSDYKDIMRNVATRITFFDAFVPGSKANTGNDGFHPSFIFMERNYQQGHTFLTEGINSSPIIYVVLSGSIELHRCEDPQDDPAQVFHHKASRFARDWTKDGHATQKYDTLTKGDVFCSLSVFPIQAYEPMSAIVATREATVYYIEGSYLERLPPKMFEALRVALMKGLTERLLRLRERIPEAFIPAERGGLSPSERSLQSSTNGSPSEKSLKSTRQSSLGEKTLKTSRQTSPSEKSLKSSHSNSPGKSARQNFRDHQLLSPARRQRRSPASRSVSPSASGSPVWNVPGVVSLR